MSLLRVVGVGKSFTDGARGRLEVLEAISLTVDEGETVVVVGPSGCGKSTLLRLIAGLLLPTSGDILLRDHSPTPGDLPIVFQDFEHSLFPWLTVRQNVTMAQSGDCPRAASDEMLETVGLLEVADEWPWRLSGGMQQRLALARALATRAQLLLMDEPFGSLDALTRYELEEEVAGWTASRNTALLLVTHDLDEAVFMADRILVLTPRPARIERVLEVDLPRPRASRETRADPRFVELRVSLHDFMTRRMK